jgi:hypothetical protein
VLALQPVREVAALVEIGQSYHLYTPSDRQEISGHLLGVLVAWAVIVGNDDDVGPDVVAFELCPPRRRRAARRGDDAQSLASRLDVLRSFEVIDSLPGAHAVYKLR